MKTTGGAHAYLGRRVGRGARLVSKLDRAIPLERLDLLLTVQGDHASPAMLLALQEQVNQRRLFTPRGTAAR
jgi:hypothetical protein